MTNFIANIPIYLGLQFNKITSLLYDLSFKLHIFFKTESGIKLSELDKSLKELKDLKSRTKVSAKPATQVNNSNRKLFNILHGDNNVQQTSKPKSNNDQT